MIQRDGAHFKDAHGRTLLLRGVNLAGSSKVPTTPNGATHLRDGFFNHRDVSFVGRPFPLDQADEHFRRLQAWGLTFLRLLVTWEAIEHAGPGIYDTDYLDYIEAVVDKAADYDMTIFIDPHQDVWSRFTGGDGAPGWTLEKVGFDIRNLHQTGAALLHQEMDDADYPSMQWASNYVKLAAGTMFTLFFAGNDFAPKTTIDGESAQEYLQRHYINAVLQVVQRMKDKPHVIGYDVHNEPSKGFIGWRHAARHQGTNVIGTTPTPYQSMLLGSGYAQDVRFLQISPLGLRPMQRRTIDPQGVRAWQEGVEGVWRQNGVWDIDANGEPQLLKPRHFAYTDEHIIDFAADCMRPFVNRYADAIHAVDPDALIFLEFDAFGQDKVPKWEPDDAPNLVYAPHWYDAFTLLTKRYLPGIGFQAVEGFAPSFGRGRVRRSFREQIEHHKEIARSRLGDVPVVIGETGIPFDLNGKAAYRTGDFSVQEEALDDTLQAVEANLLHLTLWNYTPDNSNAHGDLWNKEDLSIYSPDQRDDPADINSGGRALRTLLRPYARATSGTPLSLQFDKDTGIFEYEFLHNPAIDAPTVFYVPNYQYPDGYIVAISDGATVRDDDTQTLIYTPRSTAGLKRVQIVPATPRSEAVDVSVNWQALSLLLLSVLAFLWWQRENDDETATHDQRD